MQKNCRLQFSVISESSALLGNRGCLQRGMEFSFGDKRPEFRLNDHVAQLPHIIENIFNETFTRNHCQRRGMKGFLDLI